MDKKTLEFVTFCISKLSILLKLPQKEIYGRLKASGILYEYIVPSYDVLHTFSSRYLMEDLTEYMREKGVLEAWNYTILLMLLLNLQIRIIPAISKKKLLDYCVLKSPIYNIVYAQKECCKNVSPILKVNRYERR